MPTITLGVDGAAIVLRIREKKYTLTSPDVKISTAGSLRPDLPTVNFKYKESFDDAIDLGTLGDVLNDLQDLISSLPPPPEGAPRVSSSDDLVKQWEQVAEKLADAPILGEALATVLGTNVRIVEIGLELAKKPGPESAPQHPPPAEYNGKFRFGLMFAPHQDHRPRLFNIEVISFGAVLTLEFDATIGKLGTTPP